MKIEHIARYTGMNVIVQLKDAVAIGAGNGPGRPVPVSNQKGQILMKDGSVAPNDANPKDFAYKAVWPIAVRKSQDQSSDFRYAIEDVILSLVERSSQPEPTLPGVAVPPEMEELVLILYPDKSTGELFELAVDPAMIVGITCIRQGEMEKSSLVVAKN